MSNSKPVRTVSVRCKCGTMFDREVKRGRPQVWCESCLAKPFYTRDIPVVAVSTEPGAEVVETVSRRQLIEAAVAEVYVAHRARCAEMVANGVSVYEVGHLAGPQMAEELRAAYAQYPKSKREEDQEDEFA